MTIRFACPRCGKSLRAADEFAGRTAICSACKAEVVVPAPPAAAGSEPAWAATPAVGGEPGGKLVVLKPPKMPSPEDLVDMTAMVDIVFFLLIFFMVTSMQGLASSIGVPPPDPQKASTKGQKTVADFENDADCVIVRVDRDNTIWLEGAEVLGEQDLRARLRAKRHASSGPIKMLVLGEGDAHHGAVVMVLDAGADAGMEDVRLAVDEE